MQEYSLISGNVDNRNVFGLRIVDTDGKVYEYKYISHFYEDAEALRVKMMKDYISPVHFDDIVRDFLLSAFYSKLTANGLT